MRKSDKVVAMALAGIGTAVFVPIIEAGAKALSYRLVPETEDDGEEDDEEEAKEESNEDHKPTLQELFDQSSAAEQALFLQHLMVEIQSTMDAEKEDVHEEVDSLPDEIG